MKTLKDLINEIEINKTIRFLTYSDFLILSGWGLVNPIFAVFITDQIVGGDIKLVGLATAVYLIAKSLIQIPVARWVDLRRGERDDFLVMLIGSLLITLSAFLFIWARYPWQVYFIQLISGLGQALSYPSWLAIFTRHIDRRKEALEWSLYYTMTDLGTALAAGMGGALVVVIGFRHIFFLVGVISLAGTILLAGIARSLKKTT